MVPAPVTGAACRVMAEPGVKICPAVGLVMETIGEPLGGGVLAGLTVTDTAEEVAVAPLASNASAVSEYVPAATLDQLKV
jgi:hypothetical protein